MLSRSTPTSSKTTAAMGLLLISFTGCYHPAPPPRTSPVPAAPPKVTYNEAYDPQIKEIMDLARHERWEEAQVKVDALFERADGSRLIEPQRLSRRRGPDRECSLHPRYL